MTFLVCWGLGVWVEGGHMISVAKDGTKAFVYVQYVQSAYIFFNSFTVQLFDWLLLSYITCRVTFVV
jgi:hypothetical protein